MAITIHTEAKDGYFYVAFQGDYDFEEILKVSEEVARLAEENSADYLLLDFRNMTGDPPSTQDRYQMGKNTAALQQTKKQRINIAAVGNEPFIDPDRFGEIVAKNRGVPLKVFTDFDQAVAWIEARVQTGGKGTEL